MAIEMQEKVKADDISIEDVDSIRNSRGRNQQRDSTMMLIGKLEESKEPRARSDTIRARNSVQADMCKES